MRGIGVGHLLLPNIDQIQLEFWHIDEEERILETKGLLKITCLSFGSPSSRFGGQEIVVSAFWS